MFKFCKNNNKKNWLFFKLFANLSFLIEFHSEKANDWFFCVIQINSVFNELTGGCGGGGCDCCCCCCVGGCGACCCTRAIGIWCGGMCVEMRTGRTVASCGSIFGVKSNMRGPVAPPCCACCNEYEWWWAEAGAPTKPNKKIKLFSVFLLHCPRFFNSYLSMPLQRQHQNCHDVHLSLHHFHGHVFQPNEHVSFAAPHPTPIQFDQHLIETIEKSTSWNISQRTSRHKYYLHNWHNRDTLAPKNHGSLPMAFVADRIDSNAAVLVVHSFCFCLFLFAYEAHEEKIVFVLFFVFELTQFSHFTFYLFIPIYLFLIF